MTNIGQSPPYNERSIVFDPNQLVDIISQGFCLLDPFVAVDAARKRQITVDPVTLIFFPGGDLRKLENAQLVQNAFNLRANA